MATALGQITKQQQLEALRFAQTVAAMGGLSLSRAVSRDRIAPARGSLPVALSAQIQSVRDSERALFSKLTDDPMPFKALQKLCTGFVALARQCRTDYRAHSRGRDTISEELRVVEENLAKWQGICTTRAKAQRQRETPSGQEKLLEVMGAVDLEFRAANAKLSAMDPKRAMVSQSYLATFQEELGHLETLVTIMGNIEGHLRSRRAEDSTLDAAKECIQSHQAVSIEIQRARNDSMFSVIEGCVQAEVTKISSKASALKLEMGLEGDAGLLNFPSSEELLKVSLALVEPARSQAQGYLERSVEDPVDGTRVHPRVDELGEEFEAAAATLEMVCEDAVFGYNQILMDRAYARLDSALATFDSEVVQFAKSCKPTGAPFQKEQLEQVGASASRQQEALEGILDMRITLLSSDPVGFPKARVQAVKSTIREGTLCLASLGKQVEIAEQRLGNVLKEARIRNGVSTQVFILDEALTNFRKALGLEDDDELVSYEDAEQHFSKTGVLIEAAMRQVMEICEQTMEDPTDGPYPHPDASAFIDSAALRAAVFKRLIRETAAEYNAALLKTTSASLDDALAVFHSRIEGFSALGEMNIMVDAEPKWVFEGARSDVETAVREIKELSTKVIELSETKIPQISSEERGILQDQIEAAQILVETELEKLPKSTEIALRSIRDQEVEREMETALVHLTELQGAMTRLVKDFKTGESELFSERQGSEEYERAYALFAEFHETYAFLADEIQAAADFKTLDFDKIEVGLEEDDISQAADLVDCNAVIVSGRALLYVEPKRLLETQAERFAEYSSHLAIDASNPLGLAAGTPQEVRLIEAGKYEFVQAVHKGALDKIAAEAEEWEMVGVADGGDSTNA